MKRIKKISFNFLFVFFLTISVSIQISDLAIAGQEIRAGATFDHMRNFGEDVEYEDPNDPFAGSAFNDHNGDGIFTLDEFDESKLPKEDPDEVEVVDPDLSAPYSDEFTTGVDREIVENVLAGTTGVYRQNKGYHGEPLVDDYVTQELKTQQRFSDKWQDNAGETGDSSQAGSENKVHSVRNEVQGAVPLS